jgi:hypothetical protein
VRGSALSLEYEIINVYLHSKMSSNIPKNEINISIFTAFKKAEKRSSADRFGFLWCLMFLKLNIDPRTFLGMIIFLKFYIVERLNSMTSCF